MLVNAPLVDQLAEPTLDGQPDENARANCVPACLTSGVRALYPTAVIDGDELKDAVYGSGYTGATDPARFSAYLASRYDVRLTRFPASGTAPAQQLIAQIIQGLRGGLPVTAAIPSEWASAPADPLNPVGGTHEVLFCDYDGANLTAMNPWPVNGTSAFYQSQPVEWWQARLVYGRVFTMEGKAVWVKGVDGFYHDSAGHVCGETAGDYIASHGLIATNGVDNELYPDAPGASAFVALDNGVAVMSHHQADGSWVADENAGPTLLALFHAASNPAPAPNVAGAQQALTIAAQAVAKAESLLGGH